MANRRLVPPFVAVLMVAGSIMILSAGSAAQDTKAGDIILPEIGSGSVDGYIEALKSDLGMHRRKIIEVNMPLTDQEAASFWLLYNRYDNDKSKLNFERASIYEFYKDNFKTLTDGQARDLIRRQNSIDRMELSLNEKYAREMAKVLPLRTVLRFFQISRQVDRLVALKIMSEIPLVPTDATGAKPKAVPKDTPSE